MAWEQDYFAGRLRESLITVQSRKSMSSNLSVGLAQAHPSYVVHVLHPPVHLLVPASVDIWTVSFSFVV